MSEPKFSKEPWSVWTSHHEIADTGDYYDEIGVKDKNGRQLCIMCGDLDDGVMEANVALIKTSPKLYKKLHDILEQQCGDCCGTVDVGDIRGKTPCEKGETCPYGMDDVKALLAEARCER